MVVANVGEWGVVVIVDVAGLVLVAVGGSAKLTWFSFSAKMTAR